MSKKPFVVLWIPSACNGYKTGEFKHKEDAERFAADQDRIASGRWNGRSEIVESTEYYKHPACQAVKKT